MSDTSNLANNDTEPSMEDILSSIRKVIADDIANEADTELQAEAGDIQHATVDAEVQEHEFQDAQIDPQANAPSTEQDSKISEDILDLDLLVEDSPKYLADPTSPDITPDDTVSNTTPFDDEFYAGVEADMELEDVLGPEDVVKEEAVEKEMGDVNVAEPVSENTQYKDAEIEALSVEPGFDESLDLVMDLDATDYITTNTLLSETETETEFKTEDMPPIIENHEGAIETTQFSKDDTDISETSLEAADAREASPATQDEDIDLVKSLLADLMDEPVKGDDVEGDIETPILQDDMANAIAEEHVLAEELIIPEPAKDPVPEIDVSETDMPEADNTLAEIAEAARQASHVKSDTKTNAMASTETQSDDIVDISQTDILSKLALVGSAAADDKGEQNLDVSQDDTQQDTDQAENADLTEPVSTSTSQDETQKSEIREDEPAQEDDAMVTPLQKETLIDKETEKEASSAFASLTSAVAEKSLAEENGPPIGELVKEALKPMLQEWLDNNLKAMVQRAVNKEIKRISSGK